ncbi:nuclear protein MDM1 isoform X2 [Mixophyes fleayi]|uniref:nuclear protein MDM1 isoform X2 n=1 Tax=Mixophyes fleayi TaxID=3061075 RepID=UPI003F4D9EFD
MPVRFKGLSEYGKNFKWRTSSDSSQHRIQMSRWAGLRSDELGITKEPNFPSKRRVPYYNPQVSKSLQWKENVEYAPECLNLGRGIEKDCLVEEKIHTPDAPRLQRKSRSQSAVSRMQSADGRLAVPRMQSADGRLVVPRMQPADGRSAILQIQSTNGHLAAPRLQSTDGHSAVPQIQSTDGHSAVPRMQMADGRPVVSKTQSADGHSAVPRMQIANGRSANSKMQSADGHAAETKVKNSETEDSNIMPAPSKSSPQKETNGFHRVLQKKAGLNKAPSHHPLKLSEYRRQYERKNTTQNTPLLAAEQVIHNKNQSVPPFKLNKVVTETEYNSQYKGSPPVKGPKLRKDWEEKHLMNYDQDHHSHKRKEKKKAIFEVDSGTAKVDSSESGQKEKIKRESIKEKILQHLNNPSRCYRKAKTEYSANFSSPSEYKYKDGAWERAQQEVHDQDPPLSVGSMWVAEVKERRERAEYYRRRAQGTHFSREHLNQILSTSNKLWDVSSTSSSAEDMSNNLKALDLAGLQTSLKKEKIPQSQKKVKTASNTDLGVLESPTIPVRRKLVWDENDDIEPTEDIVPLRVEDEPEEAADTEEIDQAEHNKEEDYIKSNKERRMQRPCSMKISPPEDQSECTSMSSEVEGRLPTPKLKTHGQVQRTHHDLTTPATGGALLVSPTNHHHAPEHKHKSSTKQDCYPSNSVSKYFIERRKKKDEMPSLQSPPVAGLMTVDPLPLREDPWLSSPVSNKPSPATISYPVSRPVEKPSVPVSQQWSSSCRIHGSLRDPEFQHNGNFNSPGFYNAALNDDNSMEDDRLSQISARSAASSSLASQVLERAQRRKEYFWGKK